MYLFLTGVGLLSAIIGLFWMMDRLESPMLARIAYSGLVARLAVLGAVFSVLGLLMILVEFTRRWSA
jgi:formate-dependent nitrite reductase membrane component NrfD